MEFLEQRTWSQDPSNRLALNQEVDHHKEDAEDKQSNIIRTDEVRRYWVLVHVNVVDLEDLRPDVVQTDLDQAIAQRMLGEYKEQPVQEDAHSITLFVAPQKVVQNDDRYCGQRDNDVQTEDCHVGNTGVRKEFLEHMNGRNHGKAVEEQQQTDAVQIRSVHIHGNGVQSEDDNSQDHGDNVKGKVPGKGHAPIYLVIDPAQPLLKFLARDSFVHNVDGVSSDHQTECDQNDERDAGISHLLQSGKVRYVNPEKIYGLYYYNSSWSTIERNINNNYLRLNFEEEIWLFLEINWFEAHLMLFNLY